MEKEFEKRKRILRHILTEKKLDIILIYSRNDNYRYGKWVTGLKPFLWNYYFITGKDSGFLEIDYLTDALAFKTKEKIYPIPENIIRLDRYEKLRKYKKIGLAGDAPFAHWNGSKAKIEFIQGELDAYICIKGKSEIQGVREAASVTAKGLNILRRMIRPGISEKEIEKKLRMYFMENAEGLSFPIDVTSGRKIAFTTVSEPEERKIGKRDIICIDCGVIKNEYYSDCTRMFFVNHKQAENDYNRLKKAHYQVIKSLHVGMKIKELINAYYAEFEKSGLKYKFEYQDLGHSIGFFVHEAPFLGIKEYDNFLLRENMIFTLEPEIVLPEYRLRIEDMILIKRNGAEILT